MCGNALQQTMKRGTPNAIVTTRRTYMLSIYYDDLPEGKWFQLLHPNLAQAELKPITGAITHNPALTKVLAYDRPDIILVDGDCPILVVERTVEVPSGHNVGQRYARLAAAAQCHVPLIYFCPYAARKHGGKTAGPRYMNLRLFYALDAMALLEGTAIETINWPVDANYELILGSAKDARVKAYLSTFFGFYHNGGTAAVNSKMKVSGFHNEQIQERDRFIRSKIKRSDQYNSPPDTVTIGDTASLIQLREAVGAKSLPHTRTVLYKIGMRTIRSDPFTGAAMLYEYLYAGGADRAHRTHNMVLHFPEITITQWRTASAGRPRKDIRLYSKVADGILFRDGFLLAKQFARPS